jgi:hypothetical protein
MITISILTLTTYLFGFLVVSVVQPRSSGNTQGRDAGRVMTNTGPNVTVVAHVCEGSNGMNQTNQA